MWGFFLTWVLTSDYSGKHVSAWAIIAPAPEFIFHFHSEAVTRLWREQWGGRQRQAACSSNPCLLLFTYKSCGMHQSTRYKEKEGVQLCSPRLPFQEWKQGLACQENEACSMRTGDQEWKEVWGFLKACVPLTFPVSHLGSKVPLSFLFIRGGKPAPCFLWPTDLENIDLHGIPEALVK